MKNNSFYRIFLGFALLAGVAGGAWAERVDVNLNRGWEFSREGETGAPVTVNLPHDFQIWQPWVAPAADERADLNNSVANVKSRLSARGFKECGAGRYRKSFAADAAWQGKRVVLDFEGVMLRGDVWLNGEKVIAMDYGYLGAEADVSKLLRYDAPNIIEVVAETGEPQNSRWYTGGGLYRDVKLHVTDANMHFERHPLHITTPSVGAESATVKVKAAVNCSYPRKEKMRVRTVVTGPQGDTVAVAERPFAPKRRTMEYELDSITIASPKLWDCDAPNLYTATVELIAPNGEVADCTASRFGVRTIEYGPEFGFKLNGKKVLMKGIANHHTLGALGAAAFPDAIEKRLRLLKEFSVNHIRTSHNPYSERMLELCDELGILVVDELYDKWLTQYAGGRRDWMTQWTGDIEEWMRRDRNHPSVVMWSLGNELQTLWDIPYNDFGVTPYRMQRALMRRFDAERPVTVAMHPRGRNPQTDSLPANLALETDIASYNYRYMYFPGDSRRFPDMIFYQSEANTSGMGANWFGMNLDKVIGAAYWGAIDYLGESNGWPAKGWDKGVFDIALRPKPKAYYLRSYFKPEEPMVHIGIVDKTDATVWNDVMVGTDGMSDHWNYPAGVELTLYTYTNADEVELAVNGKVVGRKQNNVSDPARRNAVRWEKVKFEPGNIEARAYKNGKLVAKHRMETAGKAVKLVASVDEGSALWKADGTSLRHVSVRAVDAKGRTVPMAQSELKFAVSGADAEIAGVINGDITSDELTVPSNEERTVASRRLYNGEATVIVRSGVKPGDVKLTVSADGFKPVGVKLAQK